MLEDFKQPDLNRPRFRPKRLNLVNSKTLTEIQNSDKDLKNLTMSELKSILFTTNQIAQEKIIELRDGVELPEQLGYIFMGSCPRSSKRKNVDYKKSKELGKVVSHKNWETEQTVGKVFYTNYETKYHFKFHECWSFKGVRDFTRSVSANYKIDFRKYYEVTPFFRASRLFRDYIQDQKMKDEDKRKLETYDEFDL